MFKIPNNVDNIIIIQYDCLIPILSDIYPKISLDIDAPIYRYIASYFLFK